MREVFRLFLVEDDPDDQYLLKMALNESTLPIELACFDNGKKLYEHIRELNEKDLWPDLILLDLNLPVWNGKKTLEVLKKHANLKTIPVVVYTTSRSETDMQEAYLLGANSYIVKPSKFEDLLNTIETLCQYWFMVVSHN